MKTRKVLFALAVTASLAAMCPAGIIAGVDRSRGQPPSGAKTRSDVPVETYDSETDPLIGVLREGSYIFSDRLYTWVHVPLFLQGYEPMWGAPFVMTFNDDKAASEIMVTYTVTITRAACLAITVDDRVGVEPSEFLTQQEAVDWATRRIGPPGTFVDTGVDLDFWENAQTRRPQSVYATTGRMAPGTYVFGSQPTNMSFYTIIVTPEPSTLLLLAAGALLLRKRR